MQASTAVSSRDESGPRETRAEAEAGDARKAEVPHNHSLFAAGDHVAVVRAGELLVLDADRFEPVRSK